MCKFYIAVQAVKIIAPRLSIPIHYNDYTVMKSSLDDFIQAITEAGLDERVKYLSHGETHVFNVPLARIENTG